MVLKFFNLSESIVEKNCLLSGWLTDLVANHSQLLNDNAWFSKSLVLFKYESNLYFNSQWIIFMKSWNHSYDNKGESLVFNSEFVLRRWLFKSDNVHEVMFQQRLFGLVHHISSSLSIFPLSICCPFANIIILAQGISLPRHYSKSWGIPPREWRVLHLQNEKI